MYGVRSKMNSNTTSEEKTEEIYKIVKDNFSDFLFRNRKLLNGLYLQDIPYLTPKGPKKYTEIILRFDQEINKDCLIKEWRKHAK